MAIKSQMSSHYRQLRASGMSHSQAFAKTGNRFSSTFKQKTTNNGDVMIKTKSIQEKIEASDGKRISVMRFSKGSYDEECRELAPSINLLMNYKKKKIDWPEYEKRYYEEMKPKRHLIRELADRAKKEILTLLCFEKTDEQCHRRLLKNLIENVGDDANG